MTVREMTTLREQSEGKLSNKHVDMNDLDDEEDGEPAAGKKRKRAGAGGGSRAKQVTLSSVYR